MGVLADADRQGYYADLACSFPKCREITTHWTSYRYVTGRQGRVSHATKRVCEVHARRFAEKHDITISPARPSPTATQAMVTEFLTGTS